MVLNCFFFAWFTLCSLRPYAEWQRRERNILFAGKITSKNDPGPRRGLVALVVAAVVGKWHAARVNRKRHGKGARCYYSSAHPTWYIIRVVRYMHQKKKGVRRKRDSYSKEKNMLIP